VIAIIFSVGNCYFSFKHNIQSIVALLSCFGLPGSRLSTLHSFLFLRSVVFVFLFFFIVDAPLYKQTILMMMP